MQLEAIFVQIKKFIFQKGRDKIVVHLDKRKKEIGEKIYAIDKDDPLWPHLDTNNLNTIRKEEEPTVMSRVYYTYIVLKAWEHENREI